MPGFNIFPLFLQAKICTLFPPPLRPLFRPPMVSGSGVIPRKAAGLQGKQRTRQGMSILVFPVVSRVRPLPASRGMLRGREPIRPQNTPCSIQFLPSFRPEQGTRGAHGIPQPSSPKHCHKRFLPPAALPKRNRASHGTPGSFLIYGNPPAGFFCRRPFAGSLLPLGRRTHQAVPCTKRVALMSCRNWQ